MNKTTKTQRPSTHVGIDVSKDHLDVCCFNADGQRCTQRSTQVYKNTAAGHRRLLKWLGPSARVVVESTGRHGLDLTLAL